MRIVSVLPSATEIVAALGHEAWLVGRSEECDFPPSVRSIPAVMRAKHWDSDRPSSEIDRRVQTTRARGESLYSLDVDRLRSLAPDLLLTQDLCGVCSVTEDEVRSACAQAGVAPEVVSLTPRTLEEVWQSIELVGRAIGDPSRGAAFAENLRHRVADSAGPTRSRRPSVGILEWLDPPILAGLWTPDMIIAAGGEPAPTRSGEPGLRRTWPEVIAQAPDLVIVSPCSFSVDRTQQELRSSPVARSLTRLAPRFGTWIADEAYFSRPGPRLADGVDLIRHLLAVEQWQPPMPVQLWGMAAPLDGART
ncbi:MAG: ABC transporter substrate-binding protein [Thermoplasmata archaeon]